MPKGGGRAASGAGTNSSGKKLIFLTFLLWSVKFFFEKFSGQKGGRAVSGAGTNSSGKKIIFLTFLLLSVKKEFLMLC